MYVGILSSIVYGNISRGVIIMSKYRCILNAKVFFIDAHDEDETMRKALDMERDTDILYNWCEEVKS